MKQRWTFIALFFLLSSLLIPAVAAPATAAVGPETQSAQSMPPDRQAGGVDAIVISEGFEGMTFPPTAWARYNIDAGGTQWAWTLAQAHAGVASAWHQRSAGAPAEDGWLRTRPFAISALGGELRFWEYTTLGTYVDHSLYICTTSCTTPPANYSLVTSFGSPVANWREQVVSLNAWAGQNTVYLAFRYQGDNADDWYIDDVLVRSFAADLTASYKTAPADVLLGQPITYTVHLANRGDYATSATQMIDPIPAGTTYINGSLSCTAGSCSYDAGNNQVVWNGALAIGASVDVTFAVAVGNAECGTRIANQATITDPLISPLVVQAGTRVVYELPILAEDFEGTFPPGGWSRYQTGNANDPGWLRGTTGTLNSHGDPHGGTYYAWHNDDNLATPAISWLVTPQIPLPSGSPSELNFWHRTYGTFPNYHGVWISTGSGDPGAGQFVQLLNMTSEKPTVWTPRAIDLSAYAGQNIYLAFRYEGDAQDEWYLDDFFVAAPDAAYPCAYSISSMQPDHTCQSYRLDYPLTVSSLITETFDLTYTGNLWPVTIEPLSLTLSANQSAIITVSVDVPWDAPLMSIDSVTVTLEGRNTPADYRTSFLQTSYVGVEGAWQVMTPLPAGRTMLAVVATDQYVFAMGGANNAGGTIASNTNYRYDIANNSWSTMTPLPLAMLGPNAAVINNMVYIPGARAWTGAAWIWDANTYVYDIAADTWSTIPPSGTFIAAQYYGMAVDGTLLYRVGGRVNNGSGGFMTTNRVWVLDTATSQWTELAPLQQARDNLSAGWIDGQLYAAGGQNFAGSVPVLTTEVFDGSSWSYVAPPPGTGEWRFNADAVAVHGLYAIGGAIAGSTATDYTGGYAPADDEWLTAPYLPRLNNVRKDLGGDAGGGYLWATGGRSGGGTSLYAFHERLAICPVPQPQMVIDAPPLEAQICPDTTADLPIGLCNNGNGGLSFSFSEAPGDLPWLSENPVSGLVQPGTCMTPVVTLDSTGLVPGFYSGTLGLASNDPNVPSLTMPVSLTVWAPLGTASFTWSPVPPIVGQTAYFTASVSSGQPPITYNWDFGDGTPPVSGINVTHVYTAEGAFTTTLTVSNACGEVTVQEPVAVLGIPNVIVNPPALEAELCPESIVTGTLDLCNDGTGALDWNIVENAAWLSVNPTSGQVVVDGCGTVVVSYDSTGLFSGVYTTSLVILSDDPDTPTVTVPVSMTVDEIPTAGFTSNTPVCLNVSAVFTNTSSGTPPLAYLWSFGDGITSTLVNPTHLYGAAGDYTVTLAATNGCGYNQVAQPLTVLPTPAASFNYDPPAGNILLTVYFTDTSTDAISPTWDFGDGAIGAGAVVSHTYTVAGDYTVTLTVQSPYGCQEGTAFGLVHAVMPGVPVAGFQSSSPDCLDETTVFTNTTTGEGTITYLWDFGDGITSTLANPTHQYMASGIYQVSLTATNIAGSDTVRHDVEIDDLLVVGFNWSAVDLTATFTNTTVGATSYLWDLGDGTTSVLVNPVHTYAAAGTYTVTLQATGGCGTDEVAAVITVFAPCTPPAGISFIYSPTAPEPGNTVYFTSTVGAGTLPLTYTWDFGDGGSATIANPTHAFIARGSYTVTLDVSNACGSAQDEQVVVVVQTLWKIYLPLTYKGVPR